MRVAVGLLLVLLAAACDVPSTASSSPWDIRVAGASDAGVPRSGPLRLNVGRRLSPWTVDRSSVRLYSGSVAELVFPGADPIAEALVIELTRPLLLGTVYVVELDGLVDLEGVALEDTTRILFRAENNEPFEREPVAFETVGELLATRCAMGACHEANEPAAGLDLTDASGIRRTAIDKPSQLAPVTALETRGGGLFGLPLIDGGGTVQSVSRSYLIYKVLGDPHTLGEAMPPSRVGPLLSAAEIDRLARWIRAGCALD